MQHKTIKAALLLGVSLMSGVLLAPSAIAADFRSPGFTDPKPDREPDGSNRPPDRGDRGDGDRRHHRHHDDDGIVYRCTNCVVRIYTPPPNSIIVIQDQNILRGWLRNTRRVVFCAPGVTISDTGCVPTNYTRSYQIGYDAPPQLILQPLPADLTMQLHPPPGYYYALLDNDIVLVNIGTRQIADAVYLPVQ